MPMKNLLAFIFLLSIVINYSFGQDQINEGAYALKTQNFFANKTIHFEENKGQFTDNKGEIREDVLYRGKAPGVDILLTNEGLSIYLLNVKKEKKKIAGSEHGYEKTKITTWARYDIKPKNGTILKRNIIAEGELINKVNYFNQFCPDGIRHVRYFKKIIIQNIYPNIDWVIYSHGDKGIKYDFEVRPGADLEQLKLIYEGAGKLSLENGELKIKTPLGAIHEGKLYAYNKESKAQETCNYDLKTISESYDAFKYGGDAKNTYEVGYNLSQQKISETIIIDPPLTWCTMYTGNNLVGPRAIAADNNGNVFVTGYTSALDLPLINTGTYFDSTYSDTGTGNDIFILKFDKNAVLLWATYYGAEATDQANDLTIDINGNVYIAGQTFSSLFPLQDATKFFDSNNGSKADAFILKFDNTGNRLWATFYGFNSGLEKATSIVTDDYGNLFVAGSAQDAKFKTLSGAFNQDFVAGGKDAFILKFSPTTVLNWATFYGGTNDDDAKDIAIDGNGNIVVTGYTESPDFPLFNAGSGAYYDTTLAGGKDAFIIRFNSFGQRIWATLFGGTNDEEGRAVTCDSQGNVFVSGYTKSTDMDTLDAGLGGYYKNTIGGLSDVFLLKFNDSNIMQFSTYYGGSGSETDNNIVGTIVEKLITDACDNVYFSFFTKSTDCFTVDPGNGAYYKSTSGAGGADIYLAKLSNDGALLWGTYFGGSMANVRAPITINPIDGSLWLGSEFAGYDSSNITSVPLVDLGGGAYYSTNYNTTDNGTIARFGYDFQSNLTGPSDGCEDDSTWVSPSGASTYTYLWSDGSTDTITLLPPGNHSITITDTVLCLTITDSLIILPCNILVSDTSVCEGDSILLIASGASSYNWVDSATFTPVLSTDSFYMAIPATSTTYAVYNSGDTAYLTLSVLPSSSISTYDTICQGDSVQLPDGSYTSQAGVFYDTLATISGCDSIITSSIVVDQSLNATISAVSPVCINSPSFILNASDGGGIWSGTGIADINSGEFDPSVAGPGTHEIVYAISGNCGDSDTINISVFEVPSLSFLVTDESCSGENDGSVDLTVSGGAIPYTYLWNDQGGSTLEDLAVLAPGVYSVVVVDSNTCSVTGNIYVVASSELCFTPYVYIPNIFSPNADGENDKLYVQGKGIDQLTFIIYDRWGEKVFETNDQAIGWDGTYNGKTMNEAVFVYYVKATLINDEIIESQGNISLAR